MIKSRVKNGVEAQNDFQEIEMFNMSALSKSHWDKENFRLPKLLKSHLAKMAQETDTPMENIVTFSLIQTINTYILTNRPDSKKDVQLTLI